MSLLSYAIQAYFVVRMFFLLDIIIRPKNERSLFKLLVLETRRKITHVLFVSKNRLLVRRLRRHRSWDFGDPVMIQQEDPPLPHLLN